jgi:hypothetical protein
MSCFKHTGKRLRGGVAPAAAQLGSLNKAAVRQEFLQLRLLVQSAAYCSMECYVAPMILPSSS